MYVELYNLYLVACYLNHVLWYIVYTLSLTLKKDPPLVSVDCFIKHMYYPYRLREYTPILIWLWLGPLYNKDWGAGSHLLALGVGGVGAARSLLSPSEASTLTPGSGPFLWVAMWDVILWPDRYTRPYEWRFNTPDPGLVAWMAPPPPGPDAIAPCGPAGGQGCPAYSDPLCSMK